MSVREGWQIKRLDQIGEVYSGATPSTSKSEYWDGEIVWVTPNDLSKLRTPFLSTSTKKITKRGLKNCSTHLLPARSITISSRAPIGYVAVPVVDFCTNQGCKSIKLYPEYHSEFVYYNILFYVEKLKNLGEGTTFAEISKTTLSAVEIPFLDNFEEQKQIATILSTLDQAIEQTEAIIAKQKLIKTGLMQDLLTKGIDENGCIRAEATHKFKDSPLGRIPVEWDSKTLGAVAKFNSGYAFKNSELTENGWRVVRISNLHKSDFPYWHYSGRVKDSWVVIDGDILFSWAGVATSIDCVKYHGEDSLLNQHIYNLIIDDTYEKNFTYFYLQHYLPVLRSEIEGGAGQLHLTKGKIQSINIPLPEKTELKRIVNLVAEQDAAIGQHCQQLEKQHSIKTGLMHDLLTGKVRVKF